MTIFTKAGDKGTTSTPDGKRVSKADPIMGLYGALDELNVALGTATAFVGTKKSKLILHELQKQIFEISTHLMDKKAAIGDREIKEMEANIKVMEERLHVMHHFIIPGGTKGSCFIHEARVCARKVERKLAGIKAHAIYSAYFNRMSDLLFVLARWENNEEGVEAEIWKEWAD